MLRPELIHNQPDITTDSDLPYQQLIEHLPVAIYTCDKDGYISSYNQAAAGLWGRNPLIGKDLWCGSWRIYSPDGTPVSLDDCPMARVLKLERPIAPEEIILERPDGVRRNIMASPSPLFDKNGRLTGAVNLLADITEQKLQEQKTAHFAAIILSSEDAVVSKTLQGIVTSWNPAAERMFGYTAAEMIGQSITRIIPQDRQQEEPLILERLRMGERVDHFETKRITKYGVLRDISLTISPIKNSKGHIIGVSKIARDITAQKEQERLRRESEERFRLAVAATHLGIWEFNKELQEVKWSAEAQSVLGISGSQHMDIATFLSHVAPEDRDMTSCHFREAMHADGHECFDIQFRFNRPDNQQQRWLHVQCRTYDKASALPTRLLGTMLDITENKQAQEALEYMVAERTKELQQANQALASSNHELEQFAYVASHDLQEPLRKINALGDMLLSRTKDQLSPDTSNLVVRMQQASVRMKALINSLLSFSRISSGNARPELLDLNRLSSEVLDDLEAPIREKSAVISIGKMYPVVGDALQLRQLFQNLISNSLKFVAPGVAPVITIKASLVQGADSGIVVSETDRRQQFQLIEVRDNGIGFEPEYAQKIFKIFERLHGRSEYPGSGMGLSIVQKVVLNHRGYIVAGSQPGQGATFRILLPAGKLS